MQALRFLYPYCHPYWPHYTAGILLQPVSIVAHLGIPYFTGEAVGSLQEQGRVTGELKTIVSWVLVCAVVRAVTLYATRSLTIGASRRAEFDLRNHIFRHVQGLDALFFKTTHTGDLMARMSSDVDRTRVIIGPVVMYSVSTFFMLLVAIPLMVSLSWVLTLVVLLPLSLLTISVRLIGPRVHAQMLKAQETLSQLSSHAQEDFAGVRVVKSFGLEHKETERFGRAARKYYSENLRAAMYSAWMHPIIGGVGDLGQIFILLVGGVMILNGTLNLDDLVKFTGYLLSLLWPMLSIGWVVNQYQRGSASVDRLRSLLAHKPRVVDGASAGPLVKQDVDGAISIRNLSFSYGQKEVLHGIDLDVQSGESVAIIGRTGSGKSTLLSMIPRIYPVPVGAVRVDGRDVNDLPLSDLRRAIGFVPQESFLFSQTISRNIAFGCDEVDMDRVRAAAELTRLAVDIDGFPSRFEERVGERGVTLSGGQRQRAALARALIIQPRILILDDALSAVDTETEEEILQNLRRYTEGLTTLVVSHRISSIRSADRIYVLDDGRIAEQGDHEELVRLDGIYAEMYRLQLISDELESM